MKQQMEEVRESLQELCQVIIEKIKKAEKQLLFPFLQECQQLAVAWGESIENIEGTGTEVVGVLEDFCEYLYKVAQVVEEGNISIPQTEKGFQDYLAQIGQALHHLPITYEFLFLPYKASMWDCMESVYIAANKAPYCKAVVMPIPYYDRRPSTRCGFYP